MKEGLVLFAHGSREPEWATPFERIAQQLSTSYLVELAYLERMKPTLDDSYEYCRALAKQTARNFYYSFLTLPSDRKE